MSTSLWYINECYLQGNNTTESLLLLLITIGLVIIFLSQCTLSLITSFELAFGGLIVYVIIKSAFANSFNITSIGFLLFIVLLYYGVKSLFIKNINLYPAISFVNTGMIILYIILILAIYHCRFNNGLLTDFYKPNTSIFGIVLSAHMAFILPLFFKKNVKLKSWQRWFFTAVFLSAFAMLICTRGRAAWLGLTFAGLYIVYQNQTTSKRKKLVFYFSLPLLSVFFYLLFLYKSGSSGGRILIYKIAASIFKDNWLWGIGHGQFKVKYNEYQAAYFASHDINGNEALLADNSFYAFNDFFQLLIEDGIIAFLILIAVIFLLIRQIKSAVIVNRNNYLPSAAIACLICITTSALFSYSLQIFPLIIQAIICIAIINSFALQKSFQPTLPQLKTVKIISLSLTSLLLIHFSFYFRYNYKTNLAFELKRNGFKKAAMEQYAYLSKWYIKDGSVWLQYAQELYYSNQLVNAEQVLNITKKYYCSNEVYKLAAAIENDLHKFKQAEKDYKTAVFMVPNRIISRNDLLTFYSEKKDTANAVYWAGSIINMPVKIPSKITTHIHNNAKVIWLSLMKK